MCSSISGADTAALRIPRLAGRRSTTSCSDRLRASLSTWTSVASPPHPVTPTPNHPIPLSPRHPAILSLRRFIASPRSRRANSAVCLGFCLLFLAALPSQARGDDLANLERLTRESSDVSDEPSVDFAVESREIGEQAMEQARLPGEFERQSALLISCDELLLRFPDLFADIARAVGDRVAIIALVNDDEEIDLAETLLANRNLKQVRLRFVRIRHNTIWARDYGPIVIEGNGRSWLVDAAYSELNRAEDDQVPSMLGQSMRLPVLHTPLLLDGGNLLSNGRGLCITTTRILANSGGRQTEEEVRHWMAQCYGAAETLLLEPLAGEPTGHVDMFASFTSPGTVVVGWYDPLADPENSAILNRNAERLARLHMNGLPMDVQRIPMPPHEGVWRTYANVVFANGTLLVPTYADKDPEGRQAALATYSRLLPGWNVAGVEASDIAEFGGALHCVILNLGPLGRIPDLSPRRSRIVRGDASVSPIGMSSLLERATALDLPLSARGAR